MPTLSLPSTVLLDLESYFIGFSVLGLFVLFGAILVYFIPSIVAYKRKKSDFAAIFILNLLLGWTAIGWIVSLVWSLTGEKQATQNVIVSQSAPVLPIVEQTDSSATRSCPICAETIKRAAIKCRFCGADVSRSTDTNENFIYAEALTAYQQGDIGKAKTILDAVEGTPEQNTKHKALLAKIEYAATHTEESKELYRQAKEALQNNELAKAETAIAKAISLTPNVDSVKLQKEIISKIEAQNQAADLYKKGIALLHKKDFEEARTYLVEASSLAPENVEYKQQLQTVEKEITTRNFELAQASLQSGNFKDAESYINICLQYEPDNQEFTYFLNRVIEESNEKTIRRKRRVMVMAAASVVVALVVTYFIVSYRNDKKDWDYAENMNTIGAYTAYNQKHPGGSYGDEAAKKITDLYSLDKQNWEVAHLANTVTAYENYLKGGFSGNFRSTSQIVSGELIPDSFNGKFYYQAVSALDDLYWQRASDENTSEAYHAYLIIFPKGKFYQEASAKRKSIDNSTLTSSEEAQVRRILTEFLNGYTSNNFAVASTYLQPVVAVYFGAKDVPKAGIMNLFDSKAKNATGSERVELDWTSLTVKKSVDYVSVAVVADWYKTSTSDFESQETYTNYKIFASLDLQEQKILSIYRTKLSSATTSQSHPPEVMIREKQTSARSIKLLPLTPQSSD